MSLISLPPSPWLPPSFFPSLPFLSSTHPGFLLQPLCSMLLFSVLCLPPLFISIPLPICLIAYISFTLCLISVSLPVYLCFFGSVLSFSLPLSLCLCDPVLSSFSVVPFLKPQCLCICHPLSIIFFIFDLFSTSVHGYLISLLSVPISALLICPLMQSCSSLMDAYLPASPLAVWSICC